MRVARLFTEHPQSVGETYGQHLLVASGFGLRMIMGGIACVVHGLLLAARAVVRSRSSTSR